MNKKVGIVSLGFAVLLTGGIAMAQTIPGISGAGASAEDSLGISVTLPQSLPQGDAENAIGLITLDASDSSVPVTVSSIPLTVTLNGSVQGSFTNCSLRNANNVGLALNTGDNAISVINSGVETTITLDSPLTIPAGSVTNLAIACGGIPVMGSGAPYSIDIDTHNLHCYDANNSSDSIVPFLIALQEASALSNIAPPPPMPYPYPGTPSTTTQQTQSPQPGIPNTGAGGDSSDTIATLILSAIAASFGSLVLIRRKEA